MEKRRVNWTDLETHFLLSIMRDKNIIQMLDGKRHRNADIFKIVEEELKKRGFLKSISQVRSKWKALKLAYYRAKRANAVSGSERVECPYWEELDELLGHRPACNIDGVDTSSNLLDDIEYEGEEPVFFVEDPVETVELEGCNQIEPTPGPSRRSVAPEPTAGTSSRPSEETTFTAGQSRREGGPAQKKRKVDKKGTYGEALKTFSKEFTASQKEVAKMFLEKQSEIMEKEKEEQRAWERKLLEEEDRKETEKIMSNLMTKFFKGLQETFGQSLPTYQQPPNFSFFHPSQVSPSYSLPVSPTFQPISLQVPTPYPSPISGLQSNPTLVPTPYPSPITYQSSASQAPTINETHPPSQPNTKQ